MRYFLIIMLSAFPLLTMAYETEADSKAIRVSWAVAPQLNLNIPGNWKTLKPSEKTYISYGGGIGGYCRIRHKSNWFADVGVAVSYDNPKISSPGISPHDIHLERWSVPLTVSLGYSFDLSEGMEILPMVGAEASYCFSNKVSESDATSAYEWNKFNISWGFGCGLCFYEKVEIDIMGYLGFPQLIKQSSTDIYDNNIRMSFKYYF